MAILATSPTKDEQKFTGPPVCSREGGCCPAIYFDYQASTPVDRRALDAMLPYFGSAFGNPHAVGYSRGAAARRAVERARSQIADAIGADSADIFFTSGATEANNLAIKGTAKVRARRGRRIIVSEIEHKSVLQSAAALTADGFTVSCLPVDRQGTADVASLRALMGDDTILVSVMAANNEIGTVQPLAELAEICHAGGALLHVDAAQAIGKVPFNVQEIGADLVSLSAHKLYGPMGIGALYVRNALNWQPAPLLHGGDQERSVRAGTLPTPLCVGFGAAAALAWQEQATEAAHLTRLRERFVSALSDIPGFFLNGHPEVHLPGNINFGFDGVLARHFIEELPDLEFSVGSACSSGSTAISHVLKAIGLTENRARSSMRFGLGRWTTTADVDHAAHRIRNTVLCSLPIPAGAGWSH